MYKPLIVSELRKLPQWLFIYNLIIEPITIGLTILFLIFMMKDVKNTLIILSVTLMIFGFTQTLNGLFGKIRDQVVKFARFLGGIFILPAAVVLLIFSDTNILTIRIAIVLSIVLILSSISTFLTIQLEYQRDRPIGCQLFINLRDYPSGCKVTAIIVMVLSVMIYLFVVVFSNLLISNNEQNAYILLITVLATILIINGLAVIYTSVKDYRRKENVVEEIEKKEK